MRFETIEAYNLPERIEAISEYLVPIFSVNGTNGEVVVADAVYKLVGPTPYFGEHPKCIRQRALEQDGLKRKNNFALLKKEGAKQTIVFHSHIDTIGVEDYDPLKEIIHDSDVLQAFFRIYDGDPLIREHTQSGDWLFGCGVLDMKSGDAVNIATIFCYMEHMDELPYSLPLMTNAVRGNDHAGAIQASSELLRLCQEGYDFKATMNTDFIPPPCEGDEKKYIYTGAAGRMLTCFHVKGRETHVGGCLMRIDAAPISGAISLRINTDPDLAETISNEGILPSSALLQRDRKDLYNVWTNKRINLYSNTFLYEKSADATLRTLLAVSREVVQEVTTNYEERFKLYTERSHIHSNISHDVVVITFDEYLARLAKEGYDTRVLILGFLGQIRDYDKREVGFQLIDYLEARAQSDETKVIVSLAPPSRPYNYMDSDSEVDQVPGQMMTEFPEENFVRHHFFPSLSDPSCLAMRETIEDINKLKVNFLLMGSIYPLPIDTTRTLDIPVVDLGAYDVGAHTWKERIYKPYPCHTLPKVIRSFIEHLIR